MRVIQSLLLLFAAAGHALPVDTNDAAPAPIPNAVDSPFPVITPPPQQLGITLDKRQETDENSTTTIPEDSVTSTTTVITTEIVTDLKTTVAETTSTSLVVVTTTNFKTVTETVSNVETATKTVYSTSTIWKRWIDAEATAAPRAFDEYHMQPRGLVYVVKRDTVLVTEFETKKTTIEAVTTQTKKVIIKSTSTTTTESTITTTDFEDAKTTVTTTSIINVTSATEDPNPTITEEPTDSTATGTSDGGASQTGGSDGSNSDSSSESGGLSKGGKIGIGVGVGVVALFILGAVVYYLMKKRNRPEPDWYDPHNNELNDNPGMNQPTIPNVSSSNAPGEPADTNQGYRGASGPGTSPGLGPLSTTAAGKNGYGRESWGGSTGPAASPPSRYATPGNASEGGYMDIPAETGKHAHMSEMDGGVVHHAVEADSRPVVFEAPDRKYT